MTMQFDIRTLVPEHFEAAMSVWNEAGMAHEEDLHDRLNDLLSRNRGLSLAVFDGDILIGAVLVSFNGFNGYIFRLAIADGHRRSGAGRAVMKEAEARLAQVGAARAMIVCEEALNRYYERQGYSKTEARMMYKALKKI